MGDTKNIPYRISAVYLQYQISNYTCTNIKDNEFVEFEFKNPIRLLQIDRVGVQFAIRNMR